MRHLEALRRVLRGIAAAVRSRPMTFAAVSAAVAAFSLIAPVAVLSIARKPVDFFTFNPWLRRLPDYLASPEPIAAKLAYLSHLGIAWASAEGQDDIEWAFIVDVPTLLRIAATAFLFGLFFALWSHLRSGGGKAGVLGAATSVFGLTTVPCTLAGCGAPVLPVVSLAFTGLSSGTLLIFAVISQASLALVLVAMTAGIGWFAWRAGAADAHPTKV